MHILIVDDEPMVRSSIARMINSLGKSYTASEAEDGEDALLLLHERPYDLVFTDIRMPEIDGLEFTSTVKQLYPHIRVVLLTGYTEFDYALSALRYGVYEYLLKPASREKLISVIESVEAELRRERDARQIGKVRENSILEKRVQELLYGLPVPHADLALIPANESIGLFLVSASAETLGKRMIRFAMKNVLQDVLGSAGKPVVVVEDRAVAAVVFAAGRTTTEEEWLALAKHAKQTLDSLFRIDVAITCASGDGSVADLPRLYAACQDRLAPSAGSEPKAGGTEPPVAEETRHRLIRSALQWMEQEYSKELTLAALADRLYVNPNYLSTLFRSETGATFTQHLTRIRMDKAKQLLCDTHLKIYEICDRIGYQDQAYFTRLFKTVVGCTPYDYREQKC